MYSNDPGNLKTVCELMGSNSDSSFQEDTGSTPVKKEDDLADSDDG